MIPESSGQTSTNITPLAPELSQGLPSDPLSKTEPRPSPLYPVLDLTREPVDFTLFQAISLDLMLKHHFVPVHERDGYLWLAMADPLDVMAQDLLRMHLKRPLRFAAAPMAQIQTVLKKSESGQKVMEEAGEALRVQVLREEDIEEELDLENLTDKEEAPIIRLVDTAIFNALQRRASDIHMETTSNGFQIKYRIDGSLYPAADPIDKPLRLAHHQPHQGHVRAGHRREAQAPGRPVQAQGAGPGHRFPGQHHAHHPRRGRGHPHPGQGEPHRGVQDAEPGDPGLLGQ